MLISIRLEPTLKERIDSLVRSGHYPDFNSAAVVALENLWALEEEHRAATSSTSSNEVKSIAPALRESEVIPPHPIPQASSDKAKSVVTSWSPTEVSKQFVQSAPGDRFSAGDKIPLERWVFGQQNRILPLKVNARLLTHLCASGVDDLTLAKMADRISDGAVTVRSFLERLDTQFDHKKDDLLSTAFPALGSEKSRQRFAIHFVASESSNGELGGLMLEWKFAAVTRKKGKAYLYPTEAGLEWANLKNPLFDTEVTHDPEKFSSQELDWALAYVRANVPVEAFAYFTILKAIATGADDPTKLDTHLRASGIVSDQKTTPEFVATQRTGALSRMADLGLIQRIRNGVRVTYAASERGVAWLKHF